LTEFRLLSSDTMNSDRLFLHRGASVKMFYWGDQKKSQGTIFSTPTFICYTLPSSILTITPQSSSLSGQVNADGDYHVITLITDKYFALVGTRDREPEGNVTVGRERQSSGIVICTIHLNSFCSFIAVW